MVCLYRCRLANPTFASTSPPAHDFPAIRRFQVTRATTPRSTRERQTSRFITIRRAKARPGYTDDAPARFLRRRGQITTGAAGGDPVGVLTAHIAREQAAHPSLDYGYATSAGTKIGDLIDPGPVVVCRQSMPTPCGRASPLIAAADAPAHRGSGDRHHHRVHADRQQVLDQSAAPSAAGRLSVAMTGSCLVLADLSLRRLIIFSSAFMVNPAPLDS
ncbi:MAG: hypothetical protein H6522_00260 [Mycolicibacterium sp.]|nr:hypothetical protein [Mycolicibacterium sp.]